MVVVCIGNSVTRESMVVMHDYALVMRGNHGFTRGNVSVMHVWLSDMRDNHGFTIANVGRGLNPSAAEGGLFSAADGLRTRPTSHRAGGGLQYRT